MAKCCFKLNEKLFNFGDSGGCEGYVEVANYAALPATGEADIIYKTLDDEKVYEWNGSAYVELEVQSAPIGATLMKTGQTATYKTGDDGDLEIGRGTDFLTLPLDNDGVQILNPFGNNKRFTGTTGGYQVGATYYDKDGISTTSALAFPNNIRIDWSTNGIDKTKVTGYYQLTSALSHTFIQIIEWALALSVGHYTSGWFAPNIGQIFSLFHWGLSANLNYDPLNIASFSQFSSTTNNNDPSSALVMLSNSSNPMINYGKSSLRGTYLACRIFTVTGTTLT